MANILCVGHAVQDFVFSTDTMPAAPQKYRARSFESVGGGPAATAAVAVARLGGRARLAARVGDDPIGAIVIDELAAYGVDCAYVRRLAGRTSSLSAVFVDGRGERLIMNYLDPAMETAPDWLPDELPADIDAVLVDTHWPDGALHCLRLAQRAGVPGILDADVPVPGDGRLLRSATHVAFSAAGLAEYSGIPDPAAALESVSAATRAWCCVTLGGEGTMYLEKSGPKIVAAYRVEVVDTLGAGDVWHGAFALALGEGRSTAEAVMLAGAAAALKVRNGHGRGGAPKRAEVEQFMKHYTTEQRA